MKAALKVSLKAALKVLLKAAMKVLLKAALKATPTNCKFYFSRPVFFEDDVICGLSTSC